MELHWENESYSVDLVFKHATVGDGIRRSALINRELKIVKDDDSISEPEKAVRCYSYTAAMAATVSFKATSLDGSVELPSLHAIGEDAKLWLLLPEELAVEWEEAVVDANSHWVPSRRAAKAKNRKSGGKPLEPLTSESSDGLTKSQVKEENVKSSK